MPSFLYFVFADVKSFDLKPRLRGTRASEALARGQLAELHFWKFRKVFPYQSNSQNFFKFYCHFLGRRERGVFPVPQRFFAKFSSFADWLKNGGVLRGSGRGGLSEKKLFETDLRFISVWANRTCLLSRGARVKKPRNTGNPFLTKRLEYMA